jgi:hypothetical protein
MLWHYVWWWACLLALVAARSVPTVFKFVGPMHATTSTYHLAFNVNVFEFKMHCEDLQNVLLPESQSLAAQWKALHNGNGSNSKLNMGRARCVESVKRQVQAQCATVEGWPLTFLHSDNRVKKSPAVIATVLGVLGAGALLGVAAVHDVKSQAAQLNEHLAALRQDMKALSLEWGSRIDDLQREQVCLGLRADLQEADVAIRGFTDALNVLVGQRRVSPDLLPVASLVDMWGTVKEDIRNKTNGAASFPFPPNAVYETPASFVFDGVNLKAVIHLPLIKDTFTLFKRDNFPVLAVNETATPVYAANAMPFFAVNADNTLHAILDVTDVAACFDISRHKFCDSFVLRRVFSGTCEGALFAGDAAAIVKKCNLMPFLDDWALTRPSSGTYVVFSREDTQAMQVCRNGSRSSKILRQGFMDIVVSRECTLTTPHFVLPEHQQFEYDAGVVNHLRWAPGHMRTVMAHLEALNVSRDAVAGGGEIVTTTHWVLWCMVAAVATVLLVGCGVLCSLWLRWSGHENRLLAFFRHGGAGHDDGQSLRMRHSELRGSATTATTSATASAVPAGASATGAPSVDSVSID